MGRPIVGRLAPSPTGGLHLGHARTFLLAWLLARQSNGRMILRIEDLDASRVRPEALESIALDLSWLGLDWDEGPDVGGGHSPYVQSQRIEAYRAALVSLQAKSLVYPCTCTRAEIERAASAPHAEDEGPTYPGTCSHRSPEDAPLLLASGKNVAWRFRVPGGEVAWQDGIRGPVSLDPQRLGGDFIVAREPSTSSYQLAVVHDDASMGVTQVVRGDDLVPSTPRQLLLYEAFGWDPPSFAHVGLAHSPDGKRLAKRDGSIKLSAFREQGVEPGILMGHLAHSLGLSDRPEPSRAGDWIALARLTPELASPWTCPPELFDLAR